MSKAIIIVDFAYKSPKNGKSLREILKYVQYRDQRNNHLAQRDGYQRWQDHGMGCNFRQIDQHCHALQSPHVLAWTWVISPAPDLMALVPEKQRQHLMNELTERVVEDYYLQRGFVIPEYSYVQHRARTQDDQEHRHTHVILPGTAPDVADRIPVYNNKSEKHDALFREIATQHFADLLDESIGQDWRLHREQERATPSIGGLSL